MEWEAFLNHPEVKNSKRHISVGQYLLGKILHDVLDCLTSFKALANMAAPRTDIPVDVQNWLSKWLPIFEYWITTLQAFWKYKETDSQNIPDILQSICTLLSDARLPSLEVENLALPQEKISKYVIQSSVNNVVRLNLIYQDLLTKKYLRLWKTDYKDLQRRN